MKKSFLLIALTLLFGGICSGQNNYESYLSNAKNALSAGKYEQAKKNAEVYKKMTGTSKADYIIKKATAHIQSNELISKASDYFMKGQYDEALASYIEAYELVADKNTYNAIEKSAVASLDNNSITVSKSRGEILYEIYHQSSAPVDQSLGILKLSALCHDGGKAAEALGNYYMGKENYTEAAKYYEIAKSQGLNVYANLGLSYYYLSNSDKSNKDKYEKLSFENFMTAAENNEPVSQYNVGLYFMQGRGTAKDIDVAKSWLEKASNNGHEKAKKYLDDLSHRSSTDNATARPENAGITVSGHVRNSKKPLIGCAVLLSPTSNKVGTITGLEGEYTISNIPDNSILVFEYLGYITKRIKVDGKTTIDVVLQKEPTIFEKVWNNLTEDGPVLGISLVSDFSKFPIGVKGDFLWGPFHLGADISIGSSVFFKESYAYVSTSSGGVSVNGVQIEPTIELIDSEDEQTRGTFAYTITPGIFYKYVSLDCGLGQIRTNTSRIDTYKYTYSTSSSANDGTTSSSLTTSTSTTDKKKVENKNSYFVYKPGITAVIGDKDEYAFIVSARYRICPKEKALNGFELSLGITIPF